MIFILRLFYSLLIRKGVGKVGSGGFDVFRFWTTFPNPVHIIFQWKKRGRKSCPNCHCSEKCNCAIKKNPLSESNHDNNHFYSKYCLHYHTHFGVFTLLQYLFYYQEQISYFNLPPSLSLLHLTPQTTLSPAFLLPPSSSLPPNFTSPPY